MTRLAQFFQIFTKWFVVIGQKRGCHIVTSVSATSARTTTAATATATAATDTSLFYALRHGACCSHGHERHGRLFARVHVALERSRVDVHEIVKKLFGTDVTQSILDRCCD